MTDTELLHLLLGAVTDDAITDGVIVPDDAIGHDGAVHHDVLAEAASSSSTAVLVAVAVRTGDASHLDAARRCAGSRRDRQLVVLAATYLGGDHDRFDALVRDHLVEHPDHVVAAWIAAVHRGRGHTHQPDRSTSC